MLKLLYFNREVLKGWINQAKNKVLRKYRDGDGGLRNAGGIQELVNNTKDFEGKVR